MKHLLKPTFVVLASAAVACCLVSQVISFLAEKNGMSIGSDELYCSVPVSELFTDIPSETVYYWQTRSYRSQATVGFSLPFDDALKWAETFSVKSIQTSASPPISDATDLPRYIWRGSFEASAIPKCTVVACQFSLGSRDIDILIYENPSVVIVKENG